jgi:hypothetical protein
MITTTQQHVAVGQVSLDSPVVHIKYFDDRNSAARCAQKFVTRQHGCAAWVEIIESQVGA